MNILNYGSLNLDYVYQVPHFVRPGETLHADHQQVNYGGKGLNQSIALARAGAKVFHAGTIGIGGEGLERELQQNHVDTRYLTHVNSIQGNAVIQVNTAGENCILLFGGSNQEVTLEQVQKVLNQFEQGDYLVLQNEVSCLKEMIDIAADKGMNIVLNPSPFEESLKSLDYNKISWLFVNEIEAEQISGEKDPKKIWDYMHQNYPSISLVLTMGAAGSICYTPNETVKQNIYQVKAVDTTAAGDTFTGYFLASLIEDRPIAVCMERAAAASALSVSHEGAAISIPAFDQVNLMLEANN